MSKKFPTLRAELDHVVFRADWITQAVEALASRQAQDTIAIRAALQAIADTQAAQGNTLASILTEVASSDDFQSSIDAVTAALQQMTSTLAQAVGRDQPPGDQSNG
jgi:ABC-type ATPase with predicted acetyltransferase domain